MSTLMDGASADTRSVPFRLLTVVSSAGGIPALADLLGGLPSDFPVPVLVVQHLRPGHDTEIADVLGRRCALDVKLAEPGERATPGTVYVAPPDQALLIGPDATFSRSQEAHDVQPAADPLFEAAAEAFGQTVIACVLTGLGADGALGVRAIKARGGTVIVQDPDSAEFREMPDAALETTAVDFVLPLDEIATVARRLVAGGVVMVERVGDDVRSGGHAEANGDLEKLLKFLKESRGFDFTGYKRPSLSRRVSKRMSEVGIDNFVDYRDLLETNTDEFTQLFNTILINVTSFFRDPEAWDYLQREVVPELLGQIAPDDEIRVWSAGCSSGEEAYSLAIMFAETLGLEESLRRVKIYGTDVDHDALQEARSGIYSARALEPLAPDLREKYFEPHGSKYAFHPDLRRRVIFGQHDVTKDAPISRLHLLVCRNTLMYFNVETQSQIVDRFDFALRDTGHLFLGKAEILLANSEIFDTVSMRHRIFRRRPGIPQADHQPARMRFELAPQAEVWETGRHRVLRELAIELAPNPVICVDADGYVVVVNSQARNMFGLTANDVGKLFRDLEVSYRPLELRSLIEQTKSEGKSVRLNGIQMPGRDETRFLDVVVQPLWGDRRELVGVTISFMDTTLSTRLQHELQQNREDLETAYEEQQSTNEELETTNEELQSSIEEFETTNEELQSTNEELETTNEELQSGNEELETMNEELRIRTNELDHAKSFLEGVLSSVGAAVVVLDTDLRVRSWNKGAEDMWGLRPDEVYEQDFLQLDFGFPAAKIADTLRQSASSGTRVGPVTVEAVNRKGRSIVCSVTCTPLDHAGKGLVLLMDCEEQS